MGRPKTIGEKIRWHEIHGHELADQIKFVEYANVKKGAENTMKKVVLHRLHCNFLLNS